MMKLKDLYELALRCKDYNDFLEQIKKLHRYAGNPSLITIERQINVALGNKIPDSEYVDKEYVERNQM